MAKTNPVSILNDGSTFILEETKKNILAQYESLGLRASGYFGANVTVKGRELFIPAYGDFISENAVPKGVQPSRPPNASIIEAWVRAKNLRFSDPRTGRFMSFRRTAYAVAQGLFKRGSRIRRGVSKGIDYDAAVNKALNDNLNNLSNDIVASLIN